MSGGPGQQTLWVFAYGSLMWQPGFPFVEARRARLEGYHRSFCIYSLHYRGTQQRPGLVLGLARGGTCEGIAFRVADEDAPAVRAYLHARELIYGVYREAQTAGGSCRRRRPAACRCADIHRGNRASELCGRRSDGSASGDHSGGAGKGRQQSQLLRGDAAQIARAWNSAAGSGAAGGAFGGWRALCGSVRPLGTRRQVSCVFDAARGEVQSGTE